MYTPPAHMISDEERMPLPHICLYVLQMEAFESTEEQWRSFIADLAAVQTEAILMRALNMAHSRSSVHLGYAPPYII